MQRLLQSKRPSNVSLLLDGTASGKLYEYMVLWLYFMPVLLSETSYLVTDTDQHVLHLCTMKMPKNVAYYSVM